MWLRNKQRLDRAERKSRRHMFFFAMIMMLGLASFCMVSCGVDDIDISGCADETITLKGVEDKPITLTVADLKAMDCVTKTTESTSDKIGRVRATGPTLDTVLQKYGMSQAEVKRVRIYGRDDYDVKLGSDVLETEDIILAFGMGGEPLTAEDAPVRIIIPESDSAYWVRMVKKIVIEE